MKKWIGKYLMLMGVLVFTGLASVTTMTLADDSDDAKQKGAGSHVGHFRHVVCFAFFVLGFARSERNRFCLG